MKWLFLLGLVLVLAIIIASRYRRQIQMAIYVLRMFRKMRQMGKADERQIETKESPSDVPLVRCVRCGTWTSQEKALKFRSGTFYCSANCAEATANIN